MDPALPLHVSQRIPFHVIGNEAGFFPSVVTTTQVLMGPAERYDIIIDFSDFYIGDQIFMYNEGPEVPYDGMNNAELLNIHTVQVNYISAS